MAAEAARTRVDMGDIKHLEPLSRRLNAATDEFNVALETIQNKINALALGVEAWLEDNGFDELGERVSDEWWELNGRRVSSANVDDVDRVVSHRVVHVYELGYGRLGDGWGLLIRTQAYPQVKEPDGWTMDHDTPVAEFERKPLLRAARHVRVQAVDLIPRLIDKLKDESMRVIDAVEKAKKLADSLE
jgi:hypothetical protein